MTERQLEANIFGRDVSFDYSEEWVGESVLALRFIMAWIFLQAGLEKLFGNGVSGFLEDPLTGGWSAAGFFEHGVPETNPVPGLWDFFASAGITEPLVIYGQLFIGAALLLGMVLRFAALMGALQMSMFWLASLYGGPLAGLPVEHGYVMSEHIVYIFLLFGLGAVGAGRILGVDSWLEETGFVESNSWLKLFLG